MKDNSDNTGYQTHHKELGGNFRDIEALYHHAPDCPDHGGQNYQKNQLMSQAEISLGVVFLKFIPISCVAVIRHVAVDLGRDAALVVKGDAPAWEESRPLEYTVRQQDFTVRGWAAVDYGTLLEGFRTYPWLLGAMALSLLLLMLTFRFFRRKISRPIQVLMEGAERIHRGELGCRIDAGRDSREFVYLTESFNQMSGQLRHQFDRLYQEELARRDAQINPHFLNNTLETINWQARMSGDVDASRMIEALSTVLDAALDRRSSPQVRLAEEMTYVSAYLYIVTQRFGERLEVDVDLPEELMDCLVPRLILQPVIENAVEHGITPAGRGRVALRGRRRGDRLILEIENNGGLSREDEAHIARLTVAVQP